MQTTAGSLALEGFASKDAFVVERLRDAGAIIGKTNLSEWANFRSTQPVQDGAEADKQKPLYFRIHVVLVQDLLWQLQQIFAWWLY
jgi:hypothetical protein